MNKLTLSFSLLATLAIAACDKKDSPRPRAEGETLGQAVDQLGNRVERTGERAEQQLDQAGVQARQSANEATRELGLGPTTRDFGHAVGELARARCEREVRCENVGYSKRWTSETACRTEVQQSLSRDLNAQSCRAGLDERELGECMRDVRAEACDSPLDTLSRLASCRTSGLCRNIGAVSMR